MNGDFLNILLYILGGLFVALIIVVWFRSIANRRDTQKQVDYLKEAKGDIKGGQGQPQGGQGRPGTGYPSGGEGRPPGNPPGGQAAVGGDRENESAGSEDEEGGVVVEGGYGGGEGSLEHGNHLRASHSRSVSLPSDKVRLVKGPLGKVTWIADARSKNGRLCGPAPRYGTFTANLYKDDKLYAQGVEFTAISDQCNLHDASDGTKVQFVIPTKIYKTIPCQDVCLEEVRSPRTPEGVCHVCMESIDVLVSCLVCKTALSGLVKSELSYSGSEAELARWREAVLNQQCEIGI